MTTNTADTFTVSANWKGELVHLGTEKFGAKELLTLNFDQVPVDKSEADRIAAMAATDETLRDVRVEVA